MLWTIPRAATFVDELIVACEELGEAPERFPLVRRFRAKGIRRRVHGAYLIFFHERGNDVEVLHVLHGARDYLKLIGD